MRIGAGVLLARRYFLTSFKMTLRYRPAEEPGGTDFIIVTPHTHGPMEPSTSVNERMARSMAKAHLHTPLEVSSPANGRMTANGKAPYTMTTVMSLPSFQRVLGTPLTNVRHLRQSKEVHCVSGMFAVAISVTHLPQ